MKALAILAAVASILALLRTRREPVVGPEEDLYVPMAAWTWPDDRYQYGVTLNVRDYR